MRLEEWLKISGTTLRALSLKYGLNKNTLWSSAVGNGKWSQEGLLIIMKESAGLVTADEIIREHNALGYNIRKNKEGGGEDGEGHITLDPDAPQGQRAGSLSGPLRRLAGEAARMGL